MTISPVQEFNVQALKLLGSLDKAATDQLNLAQMAENLITKFGSALSGSHNLDAERNIRVLIQRISNPPPQFLNPIEQILASLAEMLGSVKNPANFSFQNKVKWIIDGHPIYELNVTSAEIPKLLQEASQKSTITYLDLSQIQKPLLFEILSYCPKYCPQLETIKAENCGADIEQADMPTLKALTNLKALTLSNQQPKSTRVTDQGALLLSELTNLTYLDLSFNFIGPVGGAALHALINLEELYLFGNTIGDTGATALVDLRKLKKLSLGMTSVSAESVPTLVASLTELTELNLSQCNLNDQIVQTIAKSLPNLIKLDLSFNPISDIGAKSLTSLTHLKWLDLGMTNSITDVGFVALLSSLSDLEYLSMYSCKLSLASFKSLPQPCAKLKNLNITDAGIIADEGFALLAQYVPNLEELSAGSTQIGDISARAIAKYMPQLKSLFVGYCHFGTGATALTNLTNLRQLYIYNNNLGDEVMMELVQYLLHLDTLYAVCCGLTDNSAIAILENLKELETLGISGNQISSRLQEALETAIPNVQ